MATDTLQPGTFDSVNSGAEMSVTGTEPVLEEIASANDSTYLGDSANNSHTSVAYFALEDPATNFSLMNANATVNLRYVKDADGANKEWNGIQAQIFQSDRSTALTDQVWVAGDGQTGTDIVGTTATESGNVTLTNTSTTANRDAWVGAVLAITYTVNKIKGGTGDEYQVTAGEIGISYDETAPPVTLTGTGSRTKTTAGSATLTVTTIPVTLTGTGSRTKITAGSGTLTTPTHTLTGTGSRTKITAGSGTLAFLPTITLTGTGAKSKVTSGDGVLYSPGTPNAVNDLAGSTGSGSGQVNLTWSQPTGVQ